MEASYSARRGICIGVQGSFACPSLQSRYRCLTVHFFLIVSIALPQSSGLLHDWYHQAEIIFRMPARSSGETPGHTLIREVNSGWLLMICAKKDAKSFWAEGLSSLFTRHLAFSVCGLRNRRLEVRILSGVLESPFSIAPGDRRPSCRRRGTTPSRWPASRKGWSKNLSDLTSVLSGQPIGKNLPSEVSSCLRGRWACLADDTLSRYTSASSDPS
jgi:hypothetical protein